MANYQFKVEYSPGKFIKMFRIIDTSTYSFYDLVDDIENTVQGLHLSQQKQSELDLEMTRAITLT